MVLTPAQHALVEQIREIIWETAAKHNVSTWYLTGHTRRRGVVWARFEVMHRARRELDAPYALIGYALGGRDHSTVMHGIKRYENR
jgi:chromosomal replication initiator protein